MLSPKMSQNLARKASRYASLKFPRRRSPARTATDSGEQQSSVSKQSDPLGSVKVTCSSLNVRAGAGTNYERLGGLTGGKSVEYYEEKDGWLRIKYGTQDGWICAKYTDYKAPEPKPDPKPEPKQVVTTDVLRLRDKAGNGGDPAPDSKILDEMPAGTLLTVTDEQNGWYEVTYNGKTGWCCAEYTKEYTPIVGGDAQTKAINYAAQFLGQKTHDLCGTIPYLEDLSWYGPSNGGYDLNCANFACAILQNFNLIGSHTNLVDSMHGLCTNFGYHKLSDISQSKPGDVWLSSGHAELVYSNDGSTVKLIGSNNVEPDVQYVSINNPYTSATLYSLQ